MEHIHKPYVHETKRIPCLKHAWLSLQIVYHFEAHPLHHIIVLTGWTKFVLVLILLWVKVFHEHCNCLSLCDFRQIKVVPAQFFYGMVGPWPRVHGGAWLCLSPVWIEGYSLPKVSLNEKNVCWRCLDFLTWLAFLHPFTLRFRSIV